MLLTGILLALSVLLLLHKLPRVHKASLEHPAASDVSITVGVIVLGMISATFSGMITGVIAGIFLSLYFTVRPKLKRPVRKERVLNPNTGGKEVRLSLPRPSLPARRKRFHELDYDQMAAVIRKRAAKPKPPISFEEAMARAQRRS